MPIVLAIETSCDDTAVAIVDHNKNILANIVYSQYLEHAPYKGVVPEIAARSHSLSLKHIINQALTEANLTFNDIDVFAATGGPGLIGGVIVGTMFAKTLALIYNKPYLAINHLEGHALTIRLCQDVSYPYLLLLISGGHCQFLAVEKFNNYKLLGQTLDDALGEAYDKVAKLLHLGYPGGPVVEQYASNGNKLAYNLPNPMIERKDCNMSFSGLKTAMRLLIAKLRNDNNLAKDEQLSQSIISDLCASFQFTVGKILANKLKYAINQYTANNNNKIIVLAGGVAANKYLRAVLITTANNFDFELLSPPINLCTDNAAMIGWVAIEKTMDNNFTPLNFCPVARWPIYKS